MTIPKAKFISLWSADPDRYGLPRNVGIKLNEKDISRAKTLLRSRWFQKRPWKEEIKRMLAGGLKYELDALANKGFATWPRPTSPESSKRKTGWTSASHADRAVAHVAATLRQREGV